VSIALNRKLGKQQNIAWHPDYIIFQIKFSDKL